MSCYVPEGGHVEVAAIGRRITATIELYGRAQILAGARTVEVQADTIAAALRQLASAFPQLVGPVIEDGRPTPAYTLNLGGQRFVTDLSQTIQPADHILLISSLSGG